ncbi:MAG: hypothetical protein NTZ17_17575 [Phycisphaerae bacterium]|nr:hypothetical protein [Phycisphaerae bacterium]
MNKAASMVSLVLVGVLAAGCQSQGTVAQVHLRVFEVPAHVLRLHAADQKPHKLSNSAYVLSVVTPNDLDAMLRANGANQGLLTERTRVIRDWPAVADTWVYSPDYAGMAQNSICRGGGGGVGSLGVRERGRNLEVRLDYMVSHNSSQGQRLIDSQIFYEHSYPEGQVLLFHTPSNEGGGSSQQHVIAFEITRDDRMSAFGAPNSRRQTPEVLAYR